MTDICCTTTKGKLPNDTMESSPKSSFQELLSPEQSPLRSLQSSHRSHQLQGQRCPNIALRSSLRTSCLVSTKKMSSVLALAKAFFDGDVDGWCNSKHISNSQDSCCHRQNLWHDDHWWAWRCWVCTHSFWYIKKKSVDFQGFQCLFVFFGHQREIVHTFEFWQLIQ